MQEKLNKLVQWAKDSNCRINDSISLVYGENGTTVVSKKDLDKGEVVLSCNESIIIGPSTARNHFHDFDPTLMRIAVKFALVKEQLLNEQSRFKPYLDTLPTIAELSNPCFYDEQDLAWLENTNLGKELPSRLQGFKQEFELGSKELGLGDEYTFNDYHWACNIFSSRSFPGHLVYPELGDDSVAILLPVIDAVNHKPMEPVQWDTSKQEFALTTGKTITQGSEVFNNYGAKSNEELLASYGFTLENNPFDTVALKLAPLPDEVLSALDNVPENLVFHLTRSTPIPEILKQIFTQMAKVNNGYESDSISSISGLEMLKPALMAKYSTLEQHINNGHTVPANRNQQFVKHYLDGQLDIYKLAFKQCNALISELRGGYGHVLDLSNLPVSFMQELPPLFGVDSPDELIDMGIEEQLVIIYICLNTCRLGVDFDSGTVQVDTAGYEEMHHDIVQPFCEEIPQLFTADLLTPIRLAQAGDLLAKNGYSHHDDQGRERFTVLL